MGFLSMFYRIFLLCYDCFVIVCLLLSHIYNKLLYFGHMNHNKYLIVVGGPTAVGKTSTSIALANSLGCDIISADSRQFYREMKVGTAKPTTEEQAQAKHHFIDSLSITEEYSVGKFETDTLDLLNSLFQKNTHCILTGGSGLYLNAIINGLDKFPAIDASFRQTLNQELDENGLFSLVKELEKSDPTYFAKVDKNNPQRVIRALEVTRATNKPFSSFLRKSPVKRPFNILPFKIEMDRESLYERINLRVDLMLKEGLKEEALSLYPQRALNALRTVGYSEWFDHFDGLIDETTAISLIKRNTRRYAKRQITWFKNQGDYKGFEQGAHIVERMLDALPR